MNNTDGTLRTITVNDPGALFNVTIKADPSASYSSYKFGPGTGITCQQRALGPEIGGTNGVTLTTTGLDWTGAGLPYYHFWFTRCSLDSGVTSATFFAEFDLTPPS
jgi:hypothetical protein